MAPKPSAQKSISSFFRPSQSSQPPPSSKRPAESVETISLLSSSDDDSLPPSRPPKLSAPLPKRPKLENSPPPVRQPTASTSAASTSSSVPIDRWRFDPSAAPEASQSAGGGGERRDQFRNKLLGRTVGRKSGYLQKEHYMAARADGESGSEEEMEVDDEDQEEEEVLHGKGKGKDKEPASQFARFAAKGTKPGGGMGKGKEKEVTKGIKYTPLEQQVLALKKANPGVLLMIEVGYKFKFYNEDAVTASRLLGIAHFPSQHMTVASIPIHVKRLINAGQKVGVVRQQETAALKKAGDNKGGPFTRALTALYTSATYIDELSVDPLESAGSSSTATLMCVVEDSKSKGDEKVTISLIAVMPNTGEIIYDVFEDGHLRSELETRMLHLQPTELLLQKNLSKQTEAMVSYHVGHDAGVAGMTCRTERITKKLKQEAASTYITDFFTTASQTDDEIVIDDNDKPNSELGKVLELPAEALVALAALVQYLKAFKLDTLFLHAHSFTHFLNRSSMSLNGNTMANLEVLRNQTDFKEKGSLMSVLDFCKTSFGRRLLRKWISKPLVSISAVNERLDAVTEIMQNSASGTLVKLRELFRGLPDLERGLVRIHLGKVTTSQELFRVLQTFQRVANVFEAADDDEDADAPAARRSIKSPLLKRIVASLPNIKKDVDGFLEQIDASKAREGTKDSMWRDPELFEALQDARDCMAAVEYEIGEQLAVCRKILKKPALQFVKIAQEEFLVEVRIADARKGIVPDTWIKINSTKAVYRYRSPEMQQKMFELEQCRERLTIEADLAFLVFLKRVAASYESLRAAISNVATADCLFSLAQAGLSPGYVRPTIVSEPGRLDIVGGRHPMVEVLFSDPFVPNDVHLGGENTKQMILTGLNMGGKSSLSRSVALIALMAQIGSYVPAESCTTSLFDGIYTRMGATDELARGRSTFMVELSETSEILKLATPRSLLILDELGRGTSTMDGQAIASAVLQYITTKLHSTCIFVTHYPSLSEVAKRYPDSVGCFHMACLENERTDGFSDVVFLYKLAEGLASRSHGLNVARMAELPESVLAKALEKSKELEAAMKARTLQRRAERIAVALKTLASGEMAPEELMGLCSELVHAGV